MSTTHTFKVAVGNGFSGEVWTFLATDEDHATSQAESKIADLGNADWRVLGVRLG